jgi:uncharacterized protein involved in oxidation of intracellular sulfur
LISILYIPEPETVWNAFRLGVVALDEKHSVKLFLLGKGVECENIKNEKYDVQKMINSFKKRSGVLLACGTCLKVRGEEESAICPISTMTDLLKLIEESDRVVTLG